MRGHFITFEGGEGSGKSSHAAILAQRLKTLGLEVVLTREPGGSTGAEIIRHILLSGIAKPLGAETEAILFAAARDDHGELLPIFVWLTTVYHKRTAAREHLHVRCPHRRPTMKDGKAPDNFTELRHKPFWNRGYQGGS